MNVLFLVMNFLLICLFFNALILKNTAFFSDKQTHISSYHTSKLALQSKIEKYKCKTYKQSRAKIKKQPALKESLLDSVSKGNPTFRSHRTKETIPALGKWNLAALTVADPQNAPLLIDLTAKLLQTLYGHTSFWQEAEKKIPHFSYRMIASFLEKKNATVLSELFPSDDQLQPLFYKMLQGSGFYDLKNRKGYPPLKDFCAFIRENPSLTNFPLAHVLIINTLFPQELTEEILSLEKTKWEKDHKTHSVTKEELIQICSMHTVALQGKSFEQIEPFLQFTNQKNKHKKLIYKDQKTQIPLEISFPS
jgi:hypothetical protein